MGKYFGTDGFRGEANVKLTAEHAFNIGRYIGEYLKNNKAHARILLGKDTRRSGDMLEAALVSGITASGSDAYLLGVTTTPAVAYLVNEDGFDCGVMISASHNPFYDNGIKLINKKGEKMDERFEERIERYIDGREPTIPFSCGKDIGRAVSYTIGNEKYIEHLRLAVGCEFSGFRIGLDCANGGASFLAPDFFKALKAEVVTMGTDPDGDNINKSCGSTHIEALKELVKKERLDAGFAFDGDADRCIAVDENSNIVDGDHILFICGKALKEEGRLKDDTVVATVMSNLGLHKAFEKEEIDIVITDVGDRNVAEKMNLGTYSLGGEQSGHIIFREYASTGDGILTAGMLLKVMKRKKMSLCSLSKEVDIYPQLLKNVRVKDKKAVMGNKKLLAAINRVKSILGDAGRVLVRESGTEQVIRIMVEAETIELCKEQVDYIAEVIKAEGLEELIC